MGTKRGRGRGAFIDSVIDVVDNFYETVVQNIKAWSAAPPKFREEVEPPQEERSSLFSTALSSQDGTEPVERHTPAVPDEQAVGDHETSARRDQAGAFGRDAVDTSPDPVDTTESSGSSDREEAPTPFSPVRMYSMPVSEES
jgi:hypothetical protein